jgi:hypothetical protein
MEIQVKVYTGKRRTARTNGQTGIHRRHIGGHTWLVLGQRDKLADEGRTGKRKDKESERRTKETGQIGMEIIGEQPKSDERQNGKRNLEVIYNSMGLDQGTGSLDMTYTQVIWLENA